MIALGAAIGALAVAVVPAAADVNPEPLWNAYPLHDGARTAVPSTNGQASKPPVARPQQRRAPAAPAPAPRRAPTAPASAPRRAPAASAPAARQAPAAADHGGRSPLLALAIGALTGVAIALAWVLAMTARGSLSRRRGRTRELDVQHAPLIPARPEPIVALPAPPAEPEECETEQCEIVWWTRGADPQFRAVGRNRTGRRYVAARSPGVADPRPPLRHGETLEAWEALVEHLNKRGWTPHGPAPNGNGRPWYAQRFERPRRPARPPARAEGDRA